jgi:hypothetical protein
MLVQFYPALQQPLQQMYNNRARFMAMAQNGPPEAPSTSADESSPAGATFFTGRGRRPRSRGEEQQQGLLSSSCDQSVVLVSELMNGRGRRGDGSSDDASSSSSDSDAGTGSAAGSPAEDRKTVSRTEHQATSSV